MTARFFLTILLVFAVLPAFSAVTYDCKISRAEFSTLLELQDGERVAVIGEVDPADGHLDWLMEHEGHEIADKARATELSKNAVVLFFEYHKQTEIQFYYDLTKQVGFVALTAGRWRKPLAEITCDIY